MASKSLQPLWMKCLDDGSQMAVMSCECLHFFTFVLRTTQIALYVSFPPSIRLKQIAAIRAKNEGSNRRHFRVITCNLQSGQATCNLDKVTFAQSEGNECASDGSFGASGEFLDFLRFALAHSWRIGSGRVHPRQERMSELPAF